MSMVLAQSRHLAAIFIAFIFTPSAAGPARRLTQDERRAGGYVWSRWVCAQRLGWDQRALAHPFSSVGGWPSTSPHEGAEVAAIRLPPLVRCWREF